MPSPGEIVGSNPDDVSSDQDLSSSEEDQEEEGVMSDDPRESFTIGRARMARLNRLNVGDEVAVLSHDGILWIGQLTDFRVTQTESNTSSSSSSSSNEVRPPTKVRKEACVHWWDCNREECKGELTYRPQWKREPNRRSRKSKRQKKSNNAFGKKPAGNWMAVQDWVSAKSIIYWCEAGKMITQKGKIALTHMKRIETRLKNYGHDLKLN